MEAFSSHHRIVFSRAFVYLYVIVFEHLMKSNRIFRKQPFVMCATKAWLLLGHPMCFVDLLCAYCVDCYLNWILFISVHGIAVQWPCNCTLYTTVNNCMRERDFLNFWMCNKKSFMGKRELIIHLYPLSCKTLFRIQSKLFSNAILGWFMI